MSGMIGSYLGYGMIAISDSITTLVCNPITTRALLSLLALMTFIGGIQRRQFAKR